MSQAVFHHIDSLKTIGPSDDDVVKVQESQRRSRETNLRQNGYWLGQIINRERDGVDLREILNLETLIDALTPARIRDAARYFDLENFVHIVLLPEDRPIN